VGIIGGDTSGVECSADAFTPDTPADSFRACSREHDHAVSMGGEMATCQEEDG